MGALALFATSTASAAILFEADAGLTTASIYEYMPDGSRSTFASNVEVAAPIAFSPSGQLFGLENTSVVKFASDGTPSTFVSGLVEPGDLAFDRDGNLFVTDYGADKILKITPDGTPSVFDSGLGAVGLAFDSSGDLFVGSLNDPVIYKYTPDGTRTVFASGIFPISLDCDKDGNLFEADYLGDINRFTPGGTKSTFSSHHDGNGIFEPTALAIAPDGTVFGASYIGGIFSFDSSGISSMFVPPGDARAGGLAFAVPEPSGCLLATLALMALAAGAGRLYHGGGNFQFGRNEPDYASKIHIVTVPACYHNYMMGQLFACQLHAAIARDVLHATDVPSAIYWNNPAVGAFMNDRVFAQGARLSWNALTKHATGEELNAKAFAAEFGAK